MNKLHAFLTIFLVVALAPLRALAAPTPYKIPSDSILLKQGASTAPKAFTGDFGLGANNPSISVDSSNQLNFNKNIFSLGDAASSIKQWIANIGAGSANPRIRYNPTGNAWQFSSDGTNFDDFGSGSGSAAGVQLLANPGFESGIATGWSNTGGTFAAVSGGGNLLIGKGSALFTASASSQFVQSTAYTVPNGLLGQSCAASIMYKGGDAGLTFQVVDGSANVLASQVISAQTVPTTINLTFICPASGTLKLKVVSSASAAAIALDQAFLGSNTLIALSQASFYGAVKWPSAASCQWTHSASNSTFAGFPADTDCVLPAGGNIEGLASAPGTKIPAIVFASLPPGDYELHATGVFSTDSVGVACSWAFSDGTTLKSAGSMGVQTTASTSNTNHLISRFHYDGSQSNVTFELQSTGDQSSAQCSIVNTSSSAGEDLQIWAVHYPSAQQQAMRPSTVANSWTGYHADDCAWSTTSTSFVDPAVDATCTFTQRTNTNFGTVVSYNDGTPGNNLPGITFTPSRVGKYQVCAFPQLTHNTVNQSTVVKLWDGTTEIAQGVFRQGGAVTGASSVPVCGQYNAASVNPVSIRMQILSTTAGGTAFIQDVSSTGTAKAIEWEIFQIDQQVPAPLVVNSVVSPSAGVTNIVAFAFAGNSGGTSACGSDPCVIVRQTGGVSSVNWAAGANYTINFTPGTFSAPPTCTFSSMDIASGIIATETVRPTTLAVGMSTFNAAGSQIDEGVNVICIGPK